MLNTKQRNAKEEEKENENKKIKSSPYLDSAVCSPFWVLSFRGSSVHQPCVRVLSSNRHSILLPIEINMRLNRGRSEAFLSISLLSLVVCLCVCVSFGGEQDG